MNLDAIGKVLLTDWINKMILMFGGVFAAVGIHFDSNAGLLMASAFLTVVHMVIGHINVRKALKTPTTTPGLGKAAALILIAGLGGLGLGGCAALQEYEPAVVTALTDLQQQAAKAQASGAVPAGKATNIVNDTSTTTSALETLVTGQPITDGQTSALVASFKLDSTSATYASLGVLVVNGLVSLTDSLIAAGKTQAEVKADQVNYLVNAPTTVQAALTTPALVSTPVNP